MWRHVCLAAALASASACSQFLGIEDFKLADAGIDAPIDAPQFCYGTSLVRACFEADPSAPIAQAAAINTDTDCQVVQPQPGGPELCLIGGTTINVTGVANIVTGGRPLVLVATDSITIAAAAVLDASSRTTTRLGSGANEATCPAAQDGLPGGAGGGGGGGGAGFGTVGGNGGNGGVSAGNGGASSTPTVLRGGCKGANGGDGTAAGGKGGNGGGAIYLIAVNSISINGSIFASAAGGTGGGVRGGGGGGGAGGMIGLDAPNITINATTGAVAANGGSGGGGGGTGTAGGAGGDGSTTSYTALATAGVGGTDGAATPTKNGGDGGRGASTIAAGGLGSNRISSTAAGGGGGGGVGVLWVKGTLTGTRYSPNPTMAP